MPTNFTILLKNYFEPMNIIIFQKFKVILLIIKHFFEIIIKIIILIFVKRAGENEFKFLRPKFCQINVE